MILVPWLESFRWAKEHGPQSLLQKRRLSFITIHYLYILSMTIIGSILLYPAGGLAYIDALFFASGCATQSGLNTVDTNKLNTYQQVILYFIPMFCTPIFIHSFVVFVRLYWFERRFQNIVKEARNFRRTRSRTMTDLIEDPKNDADEKGVQGRRILVLHDRDAPHAPGEVRDVKGSGTSSEDSGKDIYKGPHEANATAFHRDITFADELPHRTTNSTQLPLLPQQLTSEQHIAIRENQRNPKDKSTLRIPGPRDFDLGREPEALDLGDDAVEAARNTASPLERSEGSTAIAHAAQSHLNSNVASFPRLSNRKSESRGIANAPTEDNPPHSGKMRPRVGTFSSLKEWASKDNDTVAPYLSWQPTIGRNSAFVDLTEEQREELGGIEYRSLKTLAVVLVSYYLFFHIIGVIVHLPWIMRTAPWSETVQADGINKAWWGIFTPASMFNDLGYTLTPDSMQSFQKAIVPLVLGSYLIIIGNTGFPCMLRLVIWVLSILSPKGSAIWEELRFLLDHPRRCFTLLFPATATWWLFWILVILNGLDIIFFIILDLHDEAVSMINPPGYRVLNGIFQAASTRTAGFASVNLAALHPGIQVSYLIMMYISVFPIAISMRRTNVYEEKSLGIYSSPGEQKEDDNEPSYVGAHLRKQLSFDLWYIFLGLFIIAIAEGKRIENTNEYAFTLFSVLFEIVSAYGTVGLSLGYPNYNASFAGQFGVISKLVVIAMQIRGRHRGLPYALDRAVLLPSDRLHKKEDLDASRRAHVARSATEPIMQSPTNPHTTTGISTGRSGLMMPSSSEQQPRSGPVRRGVGNMMAEVVHEAHPEASPR